MVGSRLLQPPAAVSTAAKTPLAIATTCAGVGSDLLIVLPVSWPRACQFAKLTRCEEQSIDGAPRPPKVYLLLAVSATV
jgi:hypothetical protein